MSNQHLLSAAIWLGDRAQSSLSSQSSVFRTVLFFLILHLPWAHAQTLLWALELRSSFSSIRSYLTSFAFLTHDIFHLGWLRLCMHEEHIVTWQDGKVGGLRCLAGFPPPPLLSCVPSARTTIASWTQQIPIPSNTVHFIPLQSFPSFTSPPSIKGTVQILYSPAHIPQPQAKILKHSKRKKAKEKQTNYSFPKTPQSPLHPTPAGSSSPLNKVMSEVKESASF